MVRPPSFFNIARHFWTSPRLQIERGIGAARIKASFKALKVRCDGHKSNETALLQEKHELRALS